MTIKIIEKFIKSKSINQNLCEDDIFIGNRFYAIIDGATSKSNFLVEGKTTGRMATELIIKSLSALDNYDGNLSFHDIQYKINKSFNVKYNEFFTNNKKERMIASATIFDRIQDVVYIIGDCQVLLVSREKERVILNEARINQILSNKRSHYNISLINNKEATVDSLMENDLGRAHILDELKEQPKLINNLEHKHGYFVFDGTEIPENKIIKESTEDIHTIVLSSDGYPKLFNTLKESEEYLRNVLNKDPLLIHKYRSTKGLKKGNNSFDDRSYLKITK